MRRESRWKALPTAFQLVALPRLFGGRKFGGRDRNPVCTENLIRIG
jgi:hypothetical protein